MSTGPGRVIGHAGGSLGNASSWTSQSRATIGQKGEEATAAILGELVKQPGGPSVIHDARIPLPNVKANIDHIVVSGNTVTILDSKNWAPGFYWTLFGTSYRGFSAFPSADKKTVPMAVNGISAYLRDRGLKFRIGQPLLIVWPSNRSKTLNLTFLRSPGAKSVTGDRFKLAARAFVGGRPADPALLAALAELAR